MPISHAPHPAIEAVVAEPEVVEDARQGLSAANVETSRAWLRLKDAATALQRLQSQDGSVPETDDHTEARALVEAIVESIRELAPLFPHDAEYLAASMHDFARWADGGFAVPDFLDSLLAFQPQQHRVDGIRHLVVFISDLELQYTNKLFVSLRLVDFTPGYDTNSAVLFPETVAMREVPTFTWGAIFQDREAARYRRVVRAATAITKLDLPDWAAQMLDDQELTEKTFVMWDLIHDRTHMRGDLPFDPFMIKQRMPYFLYSLEELRCDLTAFRECVAITAQLRARIGDDAPRPVDVVRPVGEPVEPHQPVLSGVEAETLEQAVLVQYAVIFDRIFRFAITGSRVRNYDAVGGQLLFAWLHQRGVLHWTDTSLAFDWPNVPAAVVELSDAIDALYWQSIDRPKMAHWLAAYELVRSTLTPHPASAWARGLPDDILAGPPKGYTDAVLDDEFPLSMFFEALEKKMRPVIESTTGIRGTD